MRLTLFIRTLLFGLFLLVANLFSASYHYTVMEASPTVLHVKITFDKPEIVSTAGKAFANYEHAVFTVDQSGAYVPLISKLFNLAAEQNPRLRVLSINRQSVRVENYLFKNVTAENMPDDGDVYVKYLGKYGRIPLYSLNIFPVRYHAATQQLVWIKSLEVSISAKTVPDNVRQLTGSQGDFVRGQLLNAKQTFAVETPLAAVPLNKTAANNGNPALGYANVFKLIVNKDGLYKITYADLVDADYPVSTVNPNLLKLYNKGREIPLFFKGAQDGSFDPKDYFEFWGEQNKKTFFEQFPDEYMDPFTDDNVYWLVDAGTAGQRLTEESGGLVNTANGYVFSPYAYTETLHFEQDRHHENFGNTASLLNRPSYELDHWFYDAGISAPEGVGYDFYVPHPFESGSNVVIKAMFRGKSFYDGLSNPLQGHQVELKLRGKNERSKLIGRVQPQDGWRDQEMRMITNADSALKLPQSILENGINRLEVDMFQTGVTDIVLLNWFEIQYLRKYRAYKNFIKFSVDPDFFNNVYVNYGDTIQLNIDGFNSADIEVYKLGVSKIINGKIDLVKDGSFSSYGISFQDQIFDANTEYVAVTEAAKLKPAAIVPFRAWQNKQTGYSLLNEKNSTDYLIITHKLLYDNALKLKALKEAQGYHPVVVTVENIYDTFNQGIKSPLAIKDFIKYVWQNWNQSYPLKYVVLVGKGSYDYKGKIVENADLVPTFMYQTEKFGSAASDYWYALLSGDDYIPDVIVARIPASTNQQLLNYLDKIEHYNQQEQSESGWRNRALFISGKDNGGSDKEYLTGKPIFRAQNLRLINLRLPQHVFARRLNTVKDENIAGYDPNFGSTTDLLEYFDEGLSFVNFVGHGGGGIWADVDLLNLSDVAQMNNGYRLPFIASMTCFTGAFENPGRDALGERLLLSEKKGAIAVVAATGVGWKYNDFSIEWGLFDFLWNKDLTFGEAVNLMKIYYLNNPVYNTESGVFYTFGYGTLKRSMVSQYNFFGDPALKIQQPAQTAVVSLNESTPLPGDTVRIAVQAQGIAEGTAHIEVTDINDSLYLSKSISYNGAAETVDFILPLTSSGKIFTVKGHVYSPDNDAAGSLKFAVRKPIITKVETLPAQPQVLQPISFKLHVQSNREIQSIILKNFRDEDRTYAFSGQVTMEKLSDTLYQSLAPYSGFERGGKKYFDALVNYGDGESVTYRFNAIYVEDNRPDILVEANSLRLTGSERLMLEFTVSNQSDTTLNSVSIAVFDDFGIAHDTPFARQFVNFAPRETKTLSVYYDSLNFRDSRTFRVFADYNASIAERDENNNQAEARLTIDHFLVRRILGTTQDGQSNTAVKLAQIWDFYIAANTLSADAVIQFESKDIHALLQETGQKGLQYVTPPGRSDTSAIFIGVPAAVEQSGLQATLSLAVDTTRLSTVEKEQLAFYEYDRLLNLWVKRTSFYSHGTVKTSVSASGLFALFVGTDVKKPFIEVTADGRPIIENLPVVRQPSLSVLLQDENGVNYTGTLTMSIDNNLLIADGVPQIPGQVSIPDSLKSAKSVSITTSPNLSSGTHHLSVQVADVNGNVNVQDYTFVVNAGFDIQVYGNYPNPFSDQTIISFNVNSDNEIDDFSIKIYTTSGRLIRKRMLDLDESVAGDNVKMPALHELIWDGTDDDGNPVANGVYFAVVEGKYQGKTVKHVLKIARLR